jgi:3-dehydroquinate synthase
LDRSAFCNQVIIRQRVSVPFEYAVCFTRHVFRRDNSTFADLIASREPARRHRVLFVIDEGVVQAWPQLTMEIADYCSAYPERLELVGMPHVVPGGEQAKQSPALIENLQAEMHARGIDRHSFVIAIGGGAVLDAVGYAAATTHRGVRLVRLPTTVLSQNDSGVGVKNGINAFGAKNFLGTFAPPFAVINDAEFLRTLSRRDRRSGLAEAIKAALIRDAQFFEWLEAHAPQLGQFDLNALSRSIRVCAEIHLRHIASGGDPFEVGSARPLDFGHWAAHKLESLTDHEVRHGEAVAIGIALDSRYSEQTGLLSSHALERICGLLEALGFTLWHDALERLDETGAPTVLAGLREFQEHLGGELTVTLLGDIGRGQEVHAIESSTMIQCLRWLKARHASRDMRVASASP